MNDEELIERLRSTLQAEADAVTPMRGTPRVAPRRPRHRSGRDIALTRAVVVLASAAAIAAAVVVAFSVGHAGSGGSHTITSLPPASSGTTAPAVERPHVRKAVLTPPTTALPAAPTTAATAPPTTSTTLAPSPPVDAVPSSFVARSVTFVSTSHGWVLGTEPCASGSCLHLARTSDGGATWTDEPGPTSTGSLPIADTGRLQVRFGNAEDGWIYELGSGSYWSTTDGGASWTAGSLPDGAIDSLETAGGVVVMAATQADDSIEVLAAPITSSAFEKVSRIPAPAGGTAPAATIVLQSDAGKTPTGWVLASNDRGVVGGSRLVDGVWSPWTTTPCTSATGPALLAASDPSDLVAVCESSGAAPPTASVSSDGGDSFTPAGGGAPDAVTSVATPAPGTIVGVSAADQGTLVASIDSGAWTQVEPSVATGATIVQVGFEDAQQGVAIVESSLGGGLLQTADGGRTWSPVSLQV